MSNEASEETIYDPILGRQRDAFPGEIVRPEEEKALQRLMREGREQFRNIYDAVKGTEQLNTDELNTILKAGDVYAEIKRREYLEAIRTNPANLIKDIFVGLGPDEDLNVRAALTDLNIKIETKSAAIVDAKSVADLNGDEIDYVAAGLNTAGRVLLTYKVGPEDRQQKKVGKVLQLIDAYPGGESVDLGRLLEIIKRTKATRQFGTDFTPRPYATDFELSDLPARNPLLTGVYANLVYYKDSTGKVGRLDLNANKNFWSSVVATGQYIPYVSPK